MPEEFNITINVENKLINIKEKGYIYINVYHQSTRSAHIVSHDSSITLPLRAVGENDYLHISVVSGSSYLWKACLINIPSWADFELCAEGKVAITHLNDDGRAILKIPPGPPTWELKMMRPTAALIGHTLDNVTIAYNGPGEGGG